MRKREETKKVKIGKISIGHSNKIIIQSMCNTKTSDAKRTIDQIIKLRIIFNISFNSSCYNFCK